MALLHHRSALLTACLVFTPLLWLLWRPPLSWLSASTQQPTISIAVTGPPLGPVSFNVRPPKHKGGGVDDLSSPRAPFVAWPLKRVCDEQTAAAAAVPGLVFLCDNNSGGPGNIRNYILTCIRYAIEAGASGLVMPRIATRSPTNLAGLRAGSQPLGYMFDEAHFRTALGAACPQIELYETLEDVPRQRRPATFTAQGGKGGSGNGQGTGLAMRTDGVVGANPEEIRPKDFGARGGCDRREPNRHAHRFGPQFRKWLNESAVERGLGPPRREHPRVVRLAWGVLWDWIARADGPEFVATFGGLLRVREDVLALGERVVDAMRREVKAKAADMKNRKRFLGIHLRTENDVLENWPSYKLQLDGYLAAAESLGYRKTVAYLATGNQTEATNFAQAAASRLQVTVRSKESLLQGKDLKALQNLTWDQQALVDFVVLLRSDYFVGVSPSSFSINVALKRHLRIDGVHTRPWRVGGPGDGLSWVTGNFEKYWNDWLFMFDGMWP
ncbi:hypothetical protein PG996_000939 [Apiospora saccharicola]|uniref:Alternative oxidase n=1 Tax=Apiospora saccharicola TaxID=335842 RepID=A0ABR1WJB6_9PEZI